VTDWRAWHTGYVDPESPLSRRLRVIQGAVGGWLVDQSHPDRILSLCAGDGRDVLEVLAGRPDARRVSATLVELDPELAQRARVRAARACLDNVEVRCADAGSSATFVDRLPAGLLLLCGLFGNISDDDIERTVGALPAMIRPGGAVIWTRSRRSPDITPAIQSWLDRAGFQKRVFVAPDDVLWSVGVYDLLTPMVTDLPGRLFSFEL
jgi:hypothetical protein